MVKLLDPKAVRRRSIRQKSENTTVAYSLSEDHRIARLPTRRGFRRFFKCMFGFELAKHHEVWVEKIITEQNNDTLIAIAAPNTDLLAPRGSAKSTFTVALTAWLCGIHYDPDVAIAIQFLYVSYSIEVAALKSEEIKRIIEYSEYQKVFPWVKPNNRRWNAKQWELDKSTARINPIGTAPYTLACAGIEGAIVSKRCHVCLLDDIIKSSDAISNPEIRTKVENNWANAIRPTIFDGGRALCLATRFRGDDIHCTKFIPSEGWIQIEQSALIEVHEPGARYPVELSYWPEMYSVEMLQDFRRQEPVAFAFQYQNKILRVSQTSINPDWIQTKTPPYEFDILAIGGDLSATKKEKSDYSVFVLGGRLNNEFYILDFIRGRWEGNMSKLNAILGMLMNWGIVEQEPSLDPVKPVYLPTINQCYLYLESNAYQSSMKGDFRQYIVDELRINNLIYKPSLARGDKLSRLKGISGCFENKLIYFNRYQDFSPVIEELTNFGSSPKDDCVDAVIHLVSNLMTRRALQVV